MKDENPCGSLFNWIDCVVAVIGAVVAMAFAIMKTPASFWLSAWLIQIGIFAAVLIKQSPSHWPSTVFGLIELTYIIILLGMLSSRGVSFAPLSHMFFALLFVHGVLYFIAAKPFLIRRGYLKSQKN